MNKIAIEDILTEMITYFCKNVDKLGYKKYDDRHVYDSQSVNLNELEWFLKLAPKQKRKLSEKLIEIMEKDYNAKDKKENK